MQGLEVSPKDKRLFPDFFVQNWALANRPMRVAKVDEEDVTVSPLLATEAGTALQWSPRGKLREF